MNDIVEIKDHFLLEERTQRGTATSMYFIAGGGKAGIRTPESIVVPCILVVVF
jgi:hypothetical protein